MTWLTPLGFLGLFGLAVLLLIYLLKPNYQQRSVSSSFVWKLSLKYRKRKNPISRIRNLLILLCQIFVLTACAFVLAQPALADESNADAKEKILVIDASASMFTAVDDETRFERAVFEARELAATTLTSGGTISVILAGKTAEYVVFRAMSGSVIANNIDKNFDALIAADDFKCTYGTGDIKGAMSLAESIVIENPRAEVILYTGTKYLDKGSATIVDISDPSEWNVAVLDCRAVLDEGYYYFDIDLASYGRDTDVTVICELKGVNDGKLSQRCIVSAELSGDKVVTVKLDPASGGNGKVYSFESVDVSVEIDDSLLLDNSFHLDGGLRDVVKIQYYSERINPFFSSMLLTASSVLRDVWDIQIDEVRGENTPELEGYDFYIFEHAMPQNLPTDGIVMLVNFDRNLPTGLGVTVGGRSPIADRDNMYTFEKGEPHPITEFADVTKIGVTEYTRITDYNHDLYTPLMFCEGDPVMLFKNEIDSKIILMPFSVNMSDMSMKIEFPVIFYGIFQYFLPATTNGYVFDVGESIKVNARGDVLTVKNVGNPDWETKQITQFPTELSLDICGIYTLSQTLINEQEMVTAVFVKIPDKESNIVKTEQSLSSPVVNIPPDVSYRFDVIYAILLAMTVLLFVERQLHARALA